MAKVCSLFWHGLCFPCLEPGEILTDPSEQQGCHFVRLAMVQLCHGRYILSFYQGDFSLLCRSRPQATKEASISEV